EFSKRAVKWATNYYDRYNDAPGKEIQVIFESKKEYMGSSDAEILATMLVELSEQHALEGGVLNVPVFLDQAERYCKHRELSLRTDAVRALLAEDRVEEAETLVTEYTRVAKATSGWYNPLSTTAISNVFKKEEQRVNKLFKLPGAVGDLIGWLERGWLLSVFGPFKRGKTWWLQEFAIIALLFGLKVAFMSLEMSEDNTNERIYRRVTAFCDEGGQFIYPCLDCRKNQTGNCDLPQRKNTITLIGEDEVVPEFTPSLRYRSCTACRGNGSNRYEIASWFEMISRPKYELFRVKDRVEDFLGEVGDNLRVKVYPKFTANCQIINRDLDLLDRTEDFIPDVILIDYAGAMAPEDARETGVQRADTTWKTLAGMAQSRRVFLGTGSQGTRGSIYKPDVQQDDLAEWIGQLAHVDIMMPLNQTGEEKRRGIMRVGLLAHRHKRFFEDQQAMVLQNLDLGQVNLESEMWRA
ncbi:MAG: hypothetical protein ACXABY_29815, partial [Candidatus Thorarchaeota archaeon]